MVQDELGVGDFCLRNGNDPVSISCCWKEEMDCSLGTDRWQTKMVSYHGWLISSFCVGTTVVNLVCLIFVWGPFLVTGLETVEGVSPSFHSTSDPVGSPGPAHCIESVATESPVMLVNNACSWNPLHSLLTLWGGGLEPIPGNFLNDSKWHQSLRTMEDLHISGRAAHLQKEPQDLPEMVKV